MFPPLLLGAAVSGAAAVGSLLQHYRHQLGPMTLADVRTLERLAPTPIAHAREGLVKLVGVVDSEHPTLSLYGAVPVAVRETHYFVPDGRGLQTRKVFERVERTNTPFTVSDETGAITLVPSGCRIDFEVEGDDAETMTEELRLRVGERVAVIGLVARRDDVARQPFRQAPIEGDRGLTFLAPPLVTWRTEPEVYPRLLPRVGDVALSVGAAGMAVLGAILHL
ncbi:MAG: hypothetical protein JNK72_03205 [Myxococcales bacterium]|nr:hypothetical protein [Myxococcales bacterium]